MELLLDIALLALRIYIAKLLPGGYVTSQTVIVQNSRGIHVRPAALIIKATQGYSGTITVNRSGYPSINLNSTLSLLTLALRAGDAVTITVSGPGEVQKCTDIAELFTCRFDFPKA